MDCAVIGLPDEKWGERVTAVVQLREGRTASPAELTAFVKSRIGSVKAPKQVETWPDLPRSKVGKVLKKEIRASLLSARPPFTEMQDCISLHNPIKILPGVHLLSYAAGTNTRALYQ